MNQNQRSLRGLMTCFFVAVLASNIGCKTRPNNAAVADREGTAQIIQTKGLGGLDGYREMALFNEYFVRAGELEANNWKNFDAADLDELKAKIYRCGYVSQLRVREEKNLYAEDQREKRYTVHIQNAQGVITEERLRKRVMKALNITEAKKLKIGHAEILEKVRPVSEAFLESYLAQALLSEKDRSCLALQLKEDALKSIKGRAKDSASAAATCTLGASLAGGLGLLLTSAVNPLFGLGIIGGIAGAGLGLGGVISGGVATVTTAGGSINYLRGKDKIADSERVVRAIAELQKLQGQSVAKIGAEVDYELYPPKYGVDELDKLYADKNLTLEELERDPNIQQMQRLSLEHIERILEDAVVAAHLQALKEFDLQSSAGKRNVVAVLEDSECAPNTKLLLIKNDVQFYDNIKKTQLD